MAKRKIHPQQKAYLEVIKQASHNELDGKAVYADLMANTNQWCAVLPKAGIALLPLRDLANEFAYFVDTLYFRLTRDQLPWLIEFAKRQTADSVTVIERRGNDEYAFVKPVEFDPDIEERYREQIVKGNDLGNYDSDYMGLRELVYGDSIVVRVWWD